MEKVIVTGANGFVGSNLCRELLFNGYHVKALYRRGSNTKILEGLDVDLVEGDICDPESLLNAVEGCNGVFHIAALFRQAKNPDKVYWDVNVEGVKNVFDVAIKAGVKKIIHCSTVGVHGHIPNPPANEQEDYRPGDIYQDTKAAGERLALAYFKENKIKGAVIRPAMVWGQGDERTLKLFKGIARKRLPLIGNGKTLLHWVLVSDLAKSFRLCYESEVEDGEIFIISGQECITIERLYNEIARAFNVNPPKFKIPALPVQILGSIFETIYILLGKEPPIYRRRVDFFTKTRCFDYSKARKLLGFKPAKNFDEEVTLIANWYKKNGWI